LHTVRKSGNILPENIVLDGVGNTTPLDVNGWTFGTIHEDPTDPPPPPPPPPDPPEMIGALTVTVRVTGVATFPAASVFL
jgi:hypothetical protein